MYIQADMHRFVLCASLVVACALAQEKPRQQASKGVTTPPRPAAEQAQPPASTIPPQASSLASVFNADLQAPLPYFPGLQGFDPYDGGFNVLGGFFLPLQVTPAQGQPGASPLQQGAPPTQPSPSTPPGKAPVPLSAVPQLSGSTSSSSTTPQGGPPTQGSTPVATAAAAPQPTLSPQVPAFQLAGFPQLGVFPGQYLGRNIGITAAVQSFPGAAGPFYGGYLPAHGLFGPSF